MTESFDALELELRQVAGVVGVGLGDVDGRLHVNLWVSADADTQQLQRQAELASRTVADDAVVAVVSAEPPDVEPVARGRQRVRLLAVIRVPTTDELEVHVALGGRRTIGRHRGAGAIGSAVEATIAAIDALGLALPYRHGWSQRLGGGEPPARVAVGLVGDTEGERYGIAAAASLEEAAARATLHALNRLLTVVS